MKLYTFPFWLHPKFGIWNLEFENTECRTTRTFSTFSTEIYIIKIDLRPAARAGNFHKSFVQAENFKKNLRETFIRRFYLGISEVQIPDSNF
jgi:hypothetical protein